MIFHLFPSQAEGTEMTKTHNWLLCPKGQYGLEQEFPSFYIEDAELLPCQSVHVAGMENMLHKFLLFETLC